MVGDPAPLVSIGVPVFNGARYLAEALDSLIGQTYENLEIVISDNASTDDTEEICRSYLSRDDRIRYHRTDRNIGGSPNHNLAFRLSRGKYFLWAADDDRRLPDYVSKCVAVMEAHDAYVICYTGTCEIDECGNRTQAYREVPVSVGRSTSPSDRFQDLIRLEHRVDPIMGLIRSEVLERTSLEGQFADSDRVLLAELGLHGPFHRIDETLLERREHPGRSVRMYPSRHQRTAWFAPSEAGSLVFPHWRQLREFVSATLRAPLQLGERARCQLMLARWAWRYRSRLLEELTKNSLHIVGRAIHFNGIGSRKENHVTIE